MNTFWESCDLNVFECRDSIPKCEIWCLWNLWQHCLINHFLFLVSLVLGWGYRASDQRRWAVLHPACGGRQQSPIAIAARQAIPISIPAMELIGYQNPLPGPLTTTNNGHSGNWDLVLQHYAEYPDSKIYTYLEKWNGIHLLVKRKDLIYLNSWQTCSFVIAAQHTSYSPSSGAHHPQIQFRGRKERLPSSIHLRRSLRQWVRNWRPPLPLGRQEQPWFWTHPERYATALGNAHHSQEQKVQEPRWSAPAPRWSLRTRFLLPGEIKHNMRSFKIYISTKIYTIVKHLGIFLGSTYNLVNSLSST